jgi:hypothetical protein
MINKIYILLLLFVFASCVGEEWKENPVDGLIEKYQSKAPMSVILKDMDLKDDNYFHKYFILYKDGDEMKVDSTDWLEVNENFFILNAENLDMAIVSIDSAGNIDKLAAPPGYRHVVGNKRYGRWEDRHGGRVWVFFGQYMFYRHVFGYGARPLYYNSYNTYRSSYYGSRPYYGSKGKTEWGTSSKVTKQNRPNFHKRKTQKNGFMSRKRSSGFFSKSGSSGFRKGGGSGK